MPQQTRAARFRVKRRLEFVRNDHTRSFVAEDGSQAAFFLKQWTQERFHRKVCAARTDSQSDVNPLELQVLMAVSGAPDASGPGMNVVSTTAPSPSDTAAAVVPALPGSTVKPNALRITPSI
jgi:hypothetical protein